jgi:Carboxypeptidase regulatory-like domain
VLGSDASFGSPYFTLSVFGAGAGFGQTASLRGSVTDPTGAVVPDANVALSDSSGVTRSAVSDKNGNYSFVGLPRGSYKLQASAPAPIAVTLSGRSATINLTLKVEAAKQNINLAEQTGPTLSEENGSNASSIVLQGKDLEALADSQEDLATDLQALAGLSAGSSGGALYVDGFSGGDLPLKESIREVKINQTPFSPEFDKLGYGRIEITTKAGAEQYHRPSYFNLGDSVWNSRHPYARDKAPFLLREYGSDFGGPLNGKLAFFLNVDGAAFLASVRGLVCTQCCRCTLATRPTNLAISLCLGKTCIFLFPC